MGKKLAFGWYGGKYSHLNWLLPLLPLCHHYCEPYGGSAAVLLNRYPSPIETYNDLDGEVVNFFRVLREQQDELVRAISLTPYSREELRDAITEPLDGLSQLERARRFYVRTRQSRDGLSQSATPAYWSFARSTESSKSVSRWINSGGRLPAVAQRLLRVQIENAPAIEVIERYDSEETLFYCDPPYPHDSRLDTDAYAQYEMTDDDHCDLAKVLHSVKGKVAISGYHSPLMDKLYSGWCCTEGPIKTAHFSGKPRQEVLWTNYVPTLFGKIANGTEMLPLFDLVEKGG